MAALVFIFVMMMLNKTISGEKLSVSPHPLNGKELKKKLVRTRLREILKRILA